MHGSAPVDLLDDEVPRWYVRGERILVCALAREVLLDLNRSQRRVVVSAESAVAVVAQLNDVGRLQVGVTLAHLADVLARRQELADELRRVALELVDHRLSAVAAAHALR